MKKYLYKYVNNIVRIVKSPINKIKNTHRLMIQIESGNPYKEFKMWLLDVFQYGFVAEIIRLSLFGYKSFWYSIVMIICFGLIRWFYLDILKDTRQALK